MAEHVAEYIDDDYTMENNSKSCLKRTKKMKRIKTETPYTDNLYKLTSNDFEESTSYQHIAYTDVEELVDEPVDELVDEPVDEPVDKPTNTLIDDIDAGSQLIGDATVLVEALRMEALFRHQRKLNNHLETIDKRLNKIETHLAAMRSSEYGSKAKAKLAWPIGSMDRLKNLEERLRTGEAGIENSLKMLFARARQTSLEIFVTDNLKQMLGSSGRWTWTGLPPNSLKTGAQQHSSNKASELLCVQVLIVSRQAEDDRRGHCIQERETRKGGADQRIGYRPELQKFVGSYGLRVFMKNELLYRFIMFTGDEQIIADFVKNIRISDWTCWRRNCQREAGIGERFTSRAVCCHSMWKVEPTLRFR
ncbi:uncharacterized protein LOC134205109 isoform X2 [Armigeres subalbatus]|uniref:uncharacterized protein LOC134205109 isoform X2 n=1 Tax=Armigeres subalbatus TaxID=124917 RepID=UPI002ED534D1